MEIGGIGTNGKYCHYCKTTTHNTNDCWYKPRYTNALGPKGGGKNTKGKGKGDGRTKGGGKGKGGKNYRRGVRGVGYDDDWNYDYNDGWDYENNDWQQGSWDTNEEQPTNDD